MNWRCPYCGTKNLGEDRSCPSCGCMQQDATPDEQVRAILQPLVGRLRPPTPRPPTPPLQGVNPDHSGRIICAFLAFAAVMYVAILYFAGLL